MSSPKSILVDPGSVPTVTGTVAVPSRAESDLEGFLGREAKAGPTAGRSGSFVRPVA
jgi:hypothetical protein